MSEVKRILIVDDHFDTLRFLRSLLELADSRYEVVSVRSGEEAGLELRRTYDLLITDLRLPGVDGTEVARRAKKRLPDLPIIVISGFAKELSHIEELDIDIFCYFRKPLDADAMLAAVHTALWGELPVESEMEAEIIIEEEIVEETVEELVVDTTVTPDIEKRLEVLRMNTGAEQLILGTITGDLAAASGSLNYDINELSRTVAENLRSTFTLADQLGTEEHQTIQYQTSKRFDVYTANVGEYHFITMFFDAQARRGRIGTVWVFIQRAIRDLQPLLADVNVEVVEKTVRRKKAIEKTTNRSQEIIAKLAEEVPSAPIIAPATSKPEPVVKAEPEKAPPPPPEKPAVYEPPPPLNLEPLRDEDLKKLEALDFDDTGDDVDDFWDAAVTPEDQPLTAGVTFEEALRQGVLPNAADSPLAALLSGDESAAEGMPTTDDNGLALAEGLPDFIKAAAAGDNEPEFTLDLGPVEDDDEIDLSGMPMGDAATDEGDDEALAALAEMTTSKQSVDSEKEAEAFWNAIVSGDTSRSTASDGMTFDDALKQGILEGQLTDEEEDDDDSGEIELPKGLEALAEAGEEDVDSFWEEVVEEVDGGFATGISWEEAKKKGLIPTDLDADD